MRKYLCVLLLLCLLPGCLFKRDSRRSEYGNYLGEKASYMVDDVWTKIVDVYSPATVRLELAQVPDEFFGTPLYERLRSSGYAVQEYEKPQRRARKGSREAAGDNGYKSFGYVVDQIDSDDTYRVTCFVGSESLSRLYILELAEGETFASPVGAWVRGK